MRFGWSGWRNWPPWVIGYVGVLLVTASAMVLLLGVASCAGAYDRGLGDIGGIAGTLATFAIGVVMMRVGVAMIRSQISDEAD